MLFLFASCVFSSSAFREGGRVKVSKGKLVSADGYPLVLNGVYTAIQNDNAVTQLADTWQAKVVRAVYDPSNPEGVEEVIRSANLNGIYVIASVVGVPTEKAASFMSRIAAKFGQKGNVLYEVELGSASVAEAIRAHDGSGVILVCVSKPRELSKVVLESNVAVSVLASSERAGYKFRAALDKIEGVAVVTISGSNTPISSEEWGLWGSWASRRSISFLSGVLSQVGPGSMLTSSAIPQFEFRESQISSWGQSIRSFLREQNLMRGVVRGKKRLHADPPDFPPSGVTAQQDLDQMKWQLGISYTTQTKQQIYNDYVLPKLTELGSDVRFSTSSSGNWNWQQGTSCIGDLGPHVTIVLSGDNFLNNYILPFEKGGGYFTGVDFYGEDILGDVSDWESKRAGVFDEVQKIWGFVPEEAANLKITWTKGTEQSGNANSVAYRQYSLTGTIDTSGYPSVRNPPKIVTTVRVPSSVTSNSPIIVCYSSSVDSELWAAFGPIGVGVCAYDNTQLQPDGGAGLTSYVIGLVNKGNWRSPSDWGALVAWGWGISRLIDYWETDASIDAKRVGVTGHSRYGKATAVTIAYDERVWTAFPCTLR